MTKQKEWFEEYKVLCEKYSIWVDSCGCCSSPWPKEADEYNTLEDHLKHIQEELE